MLEGFNLDGTLNTSTPSTTVPDSPPSPTPETDHPAIILLYSGKADEALHTATAALDEARQEVRQGDSGYEQVFTALGILGDVQREIGEAQAAEASYREALELAAKHQIALLRLARVRTQLATLLDFSQREAQAAPLYEQAISDYESLNPDDLSAAQIRNNLAMIYKGLGKYALAEQHYLRSLEIIELKMGRDSEEVASVYNNLGSLYYTAGFPDQAQEMFAEGLAIRQNLLGADHPDVAQSLCNIATAKHELGDNEAAMLDFEQSLRILELHIKEEASSYEAVGRDYISLVDSLGLEKKAASFQKRMEKMLATV